MNIPDFVAGAGTSCFVSIVDSGPFSLTRAQSSLGFGEWIDQGGGWVDSRLDRNGSTAYALEYVARTGVPAPATPALPGLGLAAIRLGRRSR